MLPWKITMFCTLIVVSTASQNFNFGSFIHSPIYSKGNGGEEQRELHRQKRMDVTLGISPVEYTIAVEISLPDSSLLEALRSYLNSLSFPISVNASDSAVNISSIDFTTVCSSDGPKGPHCSCESGYEWPARTCRATPTCASATPAGESCTCLAQRPPRGTYCRPQSAGVPFIYILKMSVRLNKDFEDDLRNLSSSMFKRYKSDLEKAFTKGYKSLPGFRSVKVAGFRPGSVVVQYELTSAVNVLSESANRDAADALDRSYNIVPTSFEMSSMEVHGGTNISISPEDIFEGDTVTMTCESNSSSGATWHFPETFIRGRELLKNDTIDGKSTSTLKITNIKLEDAGYYRCSFMEWTHNVSVIHVAGTNITVSPIKIVPSEDVVIVCNGGTKELSCCTDRDMQFFTYYWKTNGAINISGTTTATHNCTKYLLQANESQCPADKSATKTDYTCELNTTNGARKHKVISVTYFRVANVSISSRTNGKISEGHRFSLSCNSDVSNFDSVTWQIQSGSSTKQVDSVWHSTRQKGKGATSVLTVDSANLDWAGNYTCTFSQRFLNSSAHMQINVFPLPLKKDIIRDPINASVPCPGTRVLRCCTSKKGNYTVKFSLQQRPPFVQAERRGKDCYQHTVNFTEARCNSTEHLLQVYCEFTNQIDGRVQSSPMVLKLLPAKKVACNSSEIGTGEDGAELTRPCLNEKNHPVKGSITYKCKNNLWEIVGKSCLAVPVDDLLSSAESLVSSPEQKKNLPEFLSHLNRTVKQQQQSMKAVANLKAVVEILNMISVVPVAAERATMENFLSTVDMVISSPTKTWKDFENGTSQLLASVEQFSDSLQPINNSIPSISYDNLQLKGVVIDKSKVSDYDESFTFSKPSNLSGSVLINEAKIKTEDSISTIISVAYSTLGPIIPQYKKMDEFIVNGLVMTTLINASSRLSQDFRIIMTFSKDNKTLKNPRCVFWNFSFSEDGGGWDNTGCESIEKGDNVTCSCNHLTSFSILMSPGHDPWDTLDYMSYIGVSISILSLVACIGIEFAVWKSVTKARISYMRHVCILNIVISLLIADIWFLVVAVMYDTNTEMDQAWLCIAAAFFVQFFYLCVFFWMLTLGLMVFYHVVFILHNAGKTIMKALGFCLGYFCPLVISAITVSSTHPHYTRKKVCLLNWDESRALLALVIPAMIIVAVNVIVTIVVIAKIQRRSIGEKSINEERSSLHRITKCIGVLTSLLGFTWLFGLATVIPGSPRAFHYLFTLFNAFQGLFILLLGILSDRKVREALWNKCSLSSWSSQHTKSTSQGMSAPMLSISSPFSKTLNNLFGKTGKYQVSSTEPTSSSASESTSKAYSLLN
ncbi:adhesion G protein-coupled receptor F5 isoform X2 [Zootoca vivipara]|uniref:adhesion G protein-coupled receptor F5 isoform X2 n=1 Tax=Zootoca vivipara TaxID=8524 RepID=UPI00159199FB|nr:adhesion G protein-coupled receptor F5 isoform X2 [Zootoca vivipara]